MRKSLFLRYVCKSSIVTGLSLTFILYNQVAWKRLFRASSKMDGGTLYQLRNLINRRNVVSDVTKNVSACEEFFDLVVESHILSAAMTLFNMKSVDAEPQNPTYFPPGSIDLDSLQRRKLLLLASDEIVSKFVDLTYCEGKRKIPDPKVHDGVHAYACEVLILGLLVKEFNDAINEGDGDRIVRCWRYFLLLFKANGRKNYSVEAFNPLAQHDFLLSPRLAKQLAWNRTINTHGYRGKNISADLHMEHLNRLAKDALLSLGSNIQDEAVERIGKCLRQTMKVLKIYDYI